MVEDVTKQKHMKFKEIAAYSLGLFGFQAIVGLLNSYQAEFDASILGADIAVVGILILIAKIVSAVFDPIVGNMIDRSSSKNGKFKSMIMYSIAPLLIMTADCVDYYEYETGKRMEGAAYSILTLTIKVCLALGTALGLVFVQLSGYSVTVAQISAGAATGFDLHTKDIVFFAYTVVPGVLALLSAIPMFKYDICGEKKAKIATELAKRRKSAE